MIIMNKGSSCLKKLDLSFNLLDDRTCEGLPLLSLAAVLCVYYYYWYYSYY